MTPQQLRIILAKLGVSQGEFAKMHNVSRQSVNAWLAGRHPVPDWIAETYEDHFENGNIKIENTP